MARIQPGTVGILPLGALGAGFYFHLTRQPAESDERVYFLQRRGSSQRRGALWKTSDEAEPREIPALFRPPLAQCAESGALPEILLVCPQPDQLLSVIGEWVELLERLHAASGLALAITDLPLLVLTSNGIYHQRVRRFLVEALEESMLYGRLPDLWNGAMEQIVGRLLRGVTMQTGQREGTGPSAIYRPGPRGITHLGGGDPNQRRRCGELLQALGGWFEISESESPTRLEFDKALVNLCGNLLGQLQAIDEQGNFRLLTVAEIFPEAESAETRALADHVIAVGRTVRAYGPDEDLETLYRAAMKVARGPRSHVPSSLKWIDLQLRSGTLQAQLGPTESWLLDPLIHYAKTAGLEEQVHYFTNLVERVTDRLRRAAARRKSAEQ